MVSFKLQAILLLQQLLVFPSVRIKMVDIVNQFLVILHALPFVSVNSRNKAIHALRHFSGQDTPPPVIPQPGDNVAIHNRFFNQYLNIHNHGAVHSSHSHNYESGLHPSWIWERWTVIDAGNGEIALHHQRSNRFLGINEHGLYGHVAAASHFHHSWVHHRFRVDALPDGWTHQQFRFQIIVVALFNHAHHRWLRMHHWDLDRSSPHGLNFPAGWLWERFLVVDVGNGQVALFGTHWKRFVGLDNTGQAYCTGPMEADGLAEKEVWNHFQALPGLQ
ncbi:unnamed protein product [Symbiodinium natans]|uniref:Uncharacterized protein n=1 Tax=Symbiodinium natans TaxID=878477 RepID=A0A812PEC4_9DINO|nr:unnamed protein product [Symbiodinium natans]